MELSQYSLTQLLHGLGLREYACLETLQSCLTSIARKEHVIGAWQHLEHDAVLLCLGKVNAICVIFSIPYGVKDTFDVKELPDESGSAIFKGRIASEDAAVIALLRGVGLFPLGKTVMTEFACFSPGKTVNPYHVDHTLGGSSSGSAAAIASCMVPFALGSQTATSVICPASYCGITALVTTQGSLALRGILPLAQSYDVLGIMARNIEDLALINGVLQWSTRKILPERPLRLFAVTGQSFARNMQTPKLN